MILKKPYGFLIKHFRLIHIVLTILTILIATETRRILMFFVDFVSNGYATTITNDLVSIYVGILIYIILLLTIGILIAIIILLKTKNKPDKAYLFAVLYYIILFVFVIIAANLINGLRTSLWATASARTYRDLAQIVYYPQFIFIIILAIRAMGFNVKQFNFKKDLEDLELTDSDSAEVELNINFKTYKAQRTVRRFARETKYYYKENKLIISVLIGVIIVIGAVLFYMNYEKVRFNYKEGASFTLSNYKMSIKDSIITNVDYAGNTINKDKVYVVIRLDITNNSIMDQEIDYNNLKLYIGNKFYYPSLELGYYFIDYADQVTNSIIGAKKQHVFAIPYEIDKKYVDSNFVIKMYNGNLKNKKDFIPKNIYVKLNPSKLLDSSVVRRAELGDVISLSGSALKESFITINNVSFTTRWRYEYESCYRESCHTVVDYVISDKTYLNRQALVVLDAKLELDNTAPSINKVNTATAFANYFFKVEYGDGENMNISSVNCVTPARVKDKIIIQTDGPVLNAKVINLLITIRNRVYSINLKKST